MNQITVKQNQDKYLQYLAAQRQLYDDDKKIKGVFLVLSLVIAFLGNGTFLALNLSVIPPLVTWIIWLYAIGNLLVLPLLTASKRQMAAKIQELFDCEILELPWNDSLGKKPEPEEIYKAYKKYKKRHTPEDWEKLKNWYTTPKLGEMKLSQARVACQRENIWWDAEQRREYARGVIIATIITFVALITVGIIADWSFRLFFQGPLALSLTILVIGISHGISHLEAAKVLDELLTRSTELWQLASRNEENESEISRRSRDLQTEIYHHRKGNLPVFSWYYARLRSKYEGISRGARDFDQ
ncbi:MAG: S-4TM family putative pore-forming effector [Chloroflexota bacterium]